MLRAWVFVRPGSFVHGPQRTKDKGLRTDLEPKNEGRRPHAIEDGKRRRCLSAKRADDDNNVRAKRYVELLTTNGQVPARVYGPDDATWMHAIRTSAVYMAVLVLALWLTAPEVTVLYARPNILWLL